MLKLQRTLRANRAQTIWGRMTIACIVTSSFISPFASEVIAAPDALSVGNWTITKNSTLADNATYFVAITKPTRTSGERPPVAFRIVCNSTRFEVDVVADGRWIASSTGAVDVTHKVGDRSAIPQRWFVSPDWKSAEYPPDSVRRFVRNLPDEERLYIGITDRLGITHEAVFELSGLREVRSYLATACDNPL